MYFGSAITNFGLETFLDSFCDLMPPPGPRTTDHGTLRADHEEFSAFVFKIQANMDPAHRDRVAFIRLCSGRFRRGMKVFHVRTGRELRLANPTHFLAQERSLAEESFPGDVLGVHDPGFFEIGDTLTGGSRFEFEQIPSFAPEHFARLVLVDPLRRKQFARGIAQLAQEGTIQLYYPPEGRGSDMILGAVGQLQMEVVKYRLDAEYGVEIRFEPVSSHTARWVTRKDGAPVTMSSLDRVFFGLPVTDVRGRAVLLFETEWQAERSQKDRDDLIFAETATGVVTRDT